MALICPEITLYNVVTQLVEFVRLDYDEQTVKDKSYISKLLKGLKLGSYDYFNQGVSVFTRKKADPRFLDVRLFFDHERATIPTIHINLPSEQPQANGIGYDEGYAGIQEDGDSFSQKYTRRYEVQYQLIITSNNPIEVSIIYRVIKALLTSAFEDLVFEGLENPSISGYDLQIDSAQGGPPFFSRALRISTAYEDIVPDIKSKKFIKSLSALGSVKDYSNE